MRRPVLVAVAQAAPMLEMLSVPAAADERLVAAQEREIRREDLGRKASLDVGDVDADDAARKLGVVQTDDLEQGCLRSSVARRRPSDVLAAIWLTFADEVDDAGFLTRHISLSATRRRGSRR